MESRRFTDVVPSEPSIFHGRDACLTVHLGTRRASSRRGGASARVGTSGETAPGVCQKSIFQEFSGNLGQKLTNGSKNVGPSGHTRRETALDGVSVIFQGGRDPLRAGTPGGTLYQMMRLLFYLRKCKAVFGPSCGYFKSQFSKTFQETWAKS